MTQRGAAYPAVAGFFGGIAAVFLFDILFRAGGALSWVLFVLAVIAAAATIIVQRRGR